MKQYMMIIAVALLLLNVPAMADVRDASHFDISPFMVDGELLTGGLDHSGVSYPPTIYVYGWEFGEDPWDPYNPADPGVFQLATIGDMPPGVGLSYNILSSLLFWDGNGDEPAWESPGEAYLTLLVGTQSRTVDSDSGPQDGSYIQAILSDGSVHKHFTTSLFAEPGAGNIPGMSGYVVPPVGLYAFQMELVLSTGYVSNPFWLVFNHGCDEAAHEQAMESLEPEVGNPDYDEDGDVDLEDFSYFQACTGSGDSMCLEYFDFDSDQDVDADDYAVFEQAITGPQTDDQPE